MVDYREDEHINEFPRHKLRLIEKLGEGRFGMVSSVINILYISCPLRKGDVMVDEYGG